MLKLFYILSLVFLPASPVFSQTYQEQNLEVKGTIQTDSLILQGGIDFPAAPVKGEVFYHTVQKKFFTFDGQSWSGANDKTVATKIVAASNSLDPSRADYLCPGTADQVKIQEAIDALGANGGAVYLLEGTYNLSGPIVLDNVAPDDSGKSLIGAGRGSLIRLGSGTNLIDAANVTSLLISRLRLDGNNIGGTHHGLSFNGVSFSKIDKLWIEQISRNGIRLNNSSNNTISNCHIQSGGGSSTGIFLLPSSNNNLIWNNQVTGGADGIFVDDSSQNRILANSVSNTLWGSGIHLLISSNNIVSGNNLRANSFFGIRLETNNSNNLISHNLIQSSGTFGLYVYNGSNNNIILGNTILNNNSWGIHIDGSANNVILANILSENTFGGIQITATFFGPPYPSFNFLSSNRISSSSLGYGILIDSSSSDTYLAGNLIDGAGYAITASSGPIMDMTTIGVKNTRYTDKTKLTLEPAGACPGAGCISLASGVPLTPTGPSSYLRLNPPFGTVNLGNPDIVPGKAAGDLLILENISPFLSRRVRLNGQGTKLHTGSGNLNLEQNDTLTLIWDGSLWVEIGYSDN